MDALEAVGIPELRQALLFVRGRRRPVSADELAELQSVHRNVARRRLDRLADTGLLVSSFERRTGRTGPGAGRPAKIYSAAPETTAIEFPARHYDDLIALLVEALPETSRPERLSDIGAALAARILRGARLAPGGDLRRGLERVCEALGRLGFHASVESVDDEVAVITTATCPLRPLVMSHHDVTEIDRGLWRGLVEAALEPPDASEVSCETQHCLDPAAVCRIVIELRGRRR